MRDSREIHADMHPPAEPRCQLHGTPGCAPCRMVEESLRRMKEGTLDPPVSKSSSTLEAFVVPKPTEDEMRGQRERLEPIIRSNIGIPPEVESEMRIESRRRFYQPLPEGKIIEWPKGLGGMTTENIAMFLVIPEVLYTDYEKHKDNQPKTI